jgi:hypothetical protein
MPFKSLLAIVLCGSLFSLARSADWPQFRGPGGSGVAADASLPSEWGPETNIKWKIEIPGAAWSQPIVVGDKVFVTTAITENQRKPSVGGGFGGRGGGGGGFGPGGAPPGGRGGPARAPEENPPANSDGGFRRATDSPRPESKAPREEAAPRGEAAAPAPTAQAKGEQAQPAPGGQRPDGDRPNRGGGFGGGVSAAVVLEADLAAASAAVAVRPTRSISGRFSASIWPRAKFYGSSSPMKASRRFPRSRRTPMRRRLPSLTASGSMPTSA